MKRIRNEQIMSTVGQYLKRRHYAESVVDVSSKKEVKVTQDVKELVLQGSVSWDGTSSNTIAYSSISGDVTACDLQYTRLKNYLQDIAEAHRSELQLLLYPMFVHIYMELLCNGQKTPAHKFFSRHSAPFQDNINHASILQALQQMFNKEDILAHRQVNEFRENKYDITLSENALQLLLSYLKSEDNVLMLQLFNQHIDLKVKRHTPNEEKELSEVQTVPEVAPLSPPLTPEKTAASTDVSLASLKQCIKQVRDGPPCLTSICMYTTLNAFQGQCSSCISPDQNLLCAGFEDSSIRIWSLTPRPLNPQPSKVNVSHVYLAGDYEEDFHEKLKSHCGEKEMAVLHGHSGSVYSVCVTKDNQFLLSGSEDKTIRLWDLATHTNCVLYRGHNYPVWDIDTSMMGNYFVSCSHDRTAKLWCMDRVYPIRTFLGHMQDVDCVRFHPNCNYVATGSTDKTVRLWSTQDGKAVRLFQGHRATVYALAFSPDGKYLASAGEDRRVKIWDLSSGTLVKDLRGHSDTVYALSFNRDSSLLASGGVDHVLRLWDTREELPSNPSDGHSSSELLGSFPVKSTTIHYLRFARYNLLMGAGAITH